MDTDLIGSLPTAMYIATAVRSGQRTAVEFTRACLDHIAAFDDELNAFQHVRATEALAEAAAVDAGSRDLPLAGVPVAVKDNLAVAGVPVRHGSAATSERPAAKDDELVRRLRAAGAIIVGTTRMPELAAWAMTASQAFGITRNPYDPSLEPGGSSGGSAVAVASGMAALAVGTDGGGSLRVPAAYCGLVAVKPTRGALPLPGDADEHWYGLSVSGPLARTAEDATLALSALGYPTTVSGTPRIAVSVKSPSPLGRPDQRQLEAVRIAAERLGAEPASPHYPLSLFNQWGDRWLAGIAQDVDRLGLDEAGLEPRTRDMVRRGRKLIRKGRPGAETWTESATRFFDDHDVLVTPVTATSPGPAGALNGKGYLRSYLTSARAVPFCPAWNLAGFPAVVVPVGMRDDLPLAVQLIGRPGSEGDLLAVAGRLEAR